MARWLSGRDLVVTADSRCAAVELLEAVRAQVTVVTRLRLDAALDPRTLAIRNLRFRLSDNSWRVQEPDCDF